ncbi:MAG TPA: sugar ABC transporter permease [Pseudonocardiaceae bacterium]|jgi:multiple sugar transport system permease protein|nr:sugar ABC transporter permease [Pseudonocardiaceae bacterium]
MGILIDEAPVTIAARPRTGRRRRQGWRARLSPWLFLAPALLAIGVFKFWPTVWGAYLSFFNVRPYLGNLWLGTANFTRALADPDLRSAVLHTGIDTVTALCLSMLIGFGLALLLEGPAQHLRFLRTAVFLPVVTAMVVVAELWGTLLFPGQYGSVNGLLGDVGLGPYPFLSSPHSALASVIAIQVWKSAPYDMLIFVAGLAGIDRELYEAAAIDGASAWQRLRTITLPGLRPITTIVLTLGVIRGLRVFTEIYVLTSGGPAGSTQTVITYAYSAGVQSNDLGYASAIATMLLVVTVVVTCLLRWWRNRVEAR